MAAGNTKYGDNALEKISFGTWNTAIGAYSEANTTTGSSNTGVGTNSLLRNETGSYNTALGTAAMCFNTIGHSNTAVGSNTMEYNTTGTQNTAVGTTALYTNISGIDNTAVGSNALYTNISGSYNTAVGMQTLHDNTSGTNNTAVGSNALYTNISGSDNTAVGQGALTPNTTGTSNTSVGVRSLNSNTTGGSNTAIGTLALNNNIIGQTNTAVGTSALYNSLGNKNVALGWNAGLNNSGDNNTFLGTGSNATSLYNSSTAIGYNSQIDDNNQIKMGVNDTQVVIPGSAILTNPSPTYTDQSIVPKSYVDLQASGITLTEACVCATTTDIDLVTGGILIIDTYTTQTGDRVLVKSQGAISLNENTANIANGIYIANDLGAWTRALDYDLPLDVAGYLTFVQNGTLNSNTAFAEITDPGVVGSDLLQYSIFYSNPYTLGDGLGISSLTLNVDAELSGPANPFLTFVGINGGTNTTYSLDSGSKDIKVHGLTVGTGSGSVSSNAAVGANALLNNTTGINNTAIGNNALVSNTSGTQNAAIGSSALYNNTTGNNNIAIGQTASRQNLTGSSNTAIGSSALYTNEASNNVAIGSSALYNNTLGTLNVAIGINALLNNTIGIQNTMIGSAAGQSITTGTSNTVLGYNSGLGLTTGSNVTCIGFQAQSSTASISNEITLGNSSIATLRCQVALTILSDARDKKDIVELNAGLNFVEQLKPVSFIWNMRDGGKVDIPDTGFIAQDLKQVQIDTGIAIPGLVYEANPEKIEASYSKLLPVLVKAIQDLKKELDELKAQMNL